jgi:dTDP-4-amino-4,6-dideoxy-D-galactose acyltransferase
MPADCCELLSWDSAHFGQRIARVRGQTIDESSVQDVLDWCAAQRIDCLYFLADASDARTAAVAAAHGFSFQDVRVLYERRLGAEAPLPVFELPEGVVCRPATEADRATLETIAGPAFVDSRFWFDERFARPAVEHLFRLWIARSLAAPDETVLVLDQDGVILGFICCRLAGAAEGEVPLAGLAASARGRGLGFALYAAALAWFGQHGRTAVRYVTQARNVKAQRLLQRLGFLIDSVRVWYHRWFSPVVSKPIPGPEEGRPCASLSTART